MALGFLAARVVAASPETAGSHDLRRTAARRPEAAPAAPPPLDLLSPTDVVIFEATADAVRARLAARTEVAGRTAPPAVWAQAATMLP